MADETVAIWLFAGIGLYVVSGGLIWYLSRYPRRDGYLEVTRGCGGLMVLAGIGVLVGILTQTTADAVDIFMLLYFFIGPLLLALFGVVLILLINYDPQSGARLSIKQIAFGVGILDILYTISSVEMLPELMDRLKTT